MALVSLALIILWVYAAVSKLETFEAFQQQLLRQPLPLWLTAPLAWGLPVMELTAALLLIYRRSRGVGLLLSFLLMLLFTGYVGLAVLGVWEELPCACGGVLSSLGWREHLVFNVVYTLVAGCGLYLWMKRA